MYRYSVYIGNQLMNDLVTFVGDANLLLRYVCLSY